MHFNTGAIFFLYFATQLILTGFIFTVLNCLPKEFINSQTNIGKHIEKETNQVSYDKIIEFVFFFFCLHYIYKQKAVNVTVTK